MKMKEENELIENGDMDNHFFTKLVLDNSSDYIIDNELYSIYRKGVEIISVPKWKIPSKDTYDEYIGNNWKYTLPRIYTLYKLNGMKQQKSILPFIKYQYKLNDTQYEKLEQQYNRFKNVLELSVVDNFSYNKPYPNLEPRIIEESIYDDNGNYTIIERLGYSSEEQKYLEINKKYIKRYNKLKKKIISAAIVYKDQIDNLKLNDNPSVKEVDELLQVMKRYWNDRYIIKKIRYVILNIERGFNSLFYMNKEYNFLSIRYYNHKNPDDRKRMDEIEKEYMNKGIYLLKEKQNSKIVSYGITWLQDKSKITNKDLSGVTGLSLPTVRKYRKSNWRDDSDKLF